MELNVGDYVRTKSGLIGKLMGSNAYDENKLAIHTKTKNDIKITPIIERDTIIKSSPNIIDLIEVGDYVNGEKVGTTIDTKELAIRNTGLIYDKPYNLIKDIDIKSVLTHEQFEAMQYVVGDTNVKD